MKIKVEVFINEIKKVMDFKDKILIIFIYELELIQSTTNLACLLILPTL